MMNIGSLLKLELYKLFNKKTTYLLIITLLWPLIFAVSMYAGASFIYSTASESFDVISDTSISAFEFATTMYSQVKYIIYLITTVIASILLSSEIEYGQIRLFVKRICNRNKIILAKYISLLIFYLLYLFIFIGTSILLYFIFVCNSKYGNGFITSDDIGKYIGMLIFSYIDLALASAVTILLGVKVKTFACFVISYILWIVAKYLDFVKSLECLVPDSCADYLLENNMSINEIIFRMLLFVLYIITILIFAMRSFNRKDLK